MTAGFDTGSAAPGVRSGGQIQDAFERNLRRALSEFNPDGVFDEVARTEAIIATRP
ncbi:hypothetical protein AB0D71_44955 [Streptomyces avermitilis]|uniref:hypothetical protein n=1 Tax=Streptomyces avermitilis TaxID=33903 RepID=UPI0033C7172F